MMSAMDDFPTDYARILERIERINVPRYARSRNFLNGAVTRLSPYLTHGVISTREVLDRILERYRFSEAEKLIFELAWRDFFQAVYAWHGANIFSDVLRAQQPVSFYHLPKVVEESTTGIQVLDSAIKTLYETGYMHNHVRMWLASLICNIARVHWREPAGWLYYHLLDGDLASNTLSWQWIAGSFASKKYYANQDNLNKYSGRIQHNTILDTTYERLSHLSIPEAYQVPSSQKLYTTLPSNALSTLPAKPLLLYHIWMLDPTWHKDLEATRVLVLEPSFFQRHPISPKRMEFILSLSKQIPHVQIYVGELSELPGIEFCLDIYTKDHPTIQHWRLPSLIKEVSESMFNPIKKEYRSFSAYWKACQDTELFEGCAHKNTEG
jgi:deoxyribodipyrimidine photo-lyase